MKLGRREFLKMSLAAGAFMPGAAALINSCSGIKRADLASAKEKGAAIAGLDKRHIAILNYASLAPSGHNSQPWPHLPRRPARS